MRVFRWEHVHKGHGPLCVAAVAMGVNWNRLFHEHSGPDEYENFNKFWFSGVDTHDYIFGWSSLDLLMANLRDGAIGKLEDMGFELMEYESYIDHICLADGQVVFNKLNASRVA